MKKKLNHWEIPTIRICKYYHKRLCGINNYCNHSCNESGKCREVRGVPWDSFSDLRACLRETS